MSLLVPLVPLLQHPELEIKKGFDGQEDHDCPTMHRRLGSAIRVNPGSTWIDRLPEVLIEPLPQSRFCRFIMALRYTRDQVEEQLIAPRRRGSPGDIFACLL